MARDGWYRIDAKKQKNGIYIVDGRFKIKRHQIPDLLEKYKEEIEFFWQWKRLGDPFGTGWMNWPCNYADIVIILSRINWQDDSNKIGSLDSIKEKTKGLVSGN